MSRHLLVASDLDGVALERNLISLREHHDPVDDFDVRTTPSQNSATSRDRILELVVVEVDRHEPVQRRSR